ncbi:MAG: NTP pyrophosphatase (non-canonical NTP hydrolase) [Rhodococcus sp. (in: high G+C Gram-positive bacteria)]|jgi:NTP pyrophosphatase (non-canonical NTP hydrolase)
MPVDGDSVLCMATLQQVMDDQREFANARDWGQFHTPKNLAMALGGEVGELSAAIADALSSPSDRAGLASLESVTSEIADVTLYLLRLFDVLGFAIPERRTQGRDESSSQVQEHLVLVTLAKLVGRVGAILELWQWSSPQEIQTTTERVEHRIVAAFDDLASVAGLVDVELADVAAAKLARNADRYPVSKSFGSHSKYTDFY